MIIGVSIRQRFADLSEQEILALAISSEEEESRIYATRKIRARPRCSRPWPRKKTSIDAP